MKLKTPIKNADRNLCSSPCQNQIFSMDKILLFKHYPHSVGNQNKHKNQIKRAQSILEKPQSSQVSQYVKIDVDFIKQIRQSLKTISKKSAKKPSPTKKDEFLYNKLHKLLDDRLIIIPQNTEVSPSSQVKNRNQKLQRQQSQPSRSNTVQSMHPHFKKRHHHKITLEIEGKNSSFSKIKPLKISPSLFEKCQKYCNEQRTISSNIKDLLAEIRKRKNDSYLIPETLRIRAESTRPSEHFRRASQGTAYQPIIPKIKKPLNRVKLRNISTSTPAINITKQQPVSQRVVLQLPILSRYQDYDDF